MQKEDIKLLQGDRKPNVIRKTADSFVCEENEEEKVSHVGSNYCGQFAFPFPPPKPLRPMSASSHCHSVSDSDSQSDSGRCYGQSSPIACRHPVYAFRGYQSDGSPVSLHSLPRFLPPIGVFWDIENCQVPKGRSAVAVAQLIRDKFFTGYREAEFLVVCDVKKENNLVVRELNDAQVNLIHVASTCKNAADEKLRQSIRRFADIHGSPASIILISGDINFAADINDLRHRKKIHVILLHMDNTSEALILCASEHYNFSELVDSLPPRGSIKSSNKPMEVVVSNLPEDVDHTRLKNRLKQLSDNCGGRVGAINKNSATIRFSSLDVASRAQKRMEGENVFGHKISVGYPIKICEKDRREESPLKNQNNNGPVRRIQNRSRDEDNFTQLNTNVTSTNLPYHSHFHTGLYQSTPAYLNLLGSSINNPHTVLNGWSSNVAASVPFTMKTTPIQGIHNQENYSYDNVGGHSPPFEVWVNSKENSENHSPSSAGLWHPPLTTRSRSPSGESKNKVSMVQASNNTAERTPEGFRRIRGAHKGNENNSQNEQSVRQAQVTRTASIIDSAAVTRNMCRPPPTANNRGPSPIALAMAAINGESRQWPSKLPRDTIPRKCRTPSPYFRVSSNGCPSGEKSYSAITRSRTPTPVSRSSTSPFNLLFDECEESKHFFYPIPNSSKMMQNESGTNESIELQVTNLDPTIGAKDMKKTLLSVFGEYVVVQNVSVFTPSDGNLHAVVKVPSTQDAQYAISKLQRLKIGFKRINISRTNVTGPSPQILRSQIIALLLDVPGYSLPLFKFCELFESRYQLSISISDFSKVKDVCVVKEGPNGRTVSLHSDHRNTPSPLLPAIQDDGQSMELLFCPIHIVKPQPNKGWAEHEMATLPNVRIELKLLAVRIHSLLQLHNGKLHLSSLPICYKSQFEPLVEDEGGVALEHLVSCLPGVEIYLSTGCVKYLRWLKAKSPGETLETNIGPSVSPPLAGQLALFSRELVDLLKISPRSQLLFNRFIPAYHHHFGRQCRVADYGFTKLLELLEALPHIVQVMGEGNKRVITLCHRVQVRRFTSDLLRVLKYQASKQAMLSEFPVLYEQVLNRPWDVVEYGMCELKDLLAEVSDNTVVVSHQGNDMQISIPKREQTPEEMEKTKQFSAEVVELLRHAPNFTMLFNKFIPAHHIHFGWQCRVADYGFTKLIELFEAIPNIVKIELLDDERRISLTLQERLKVLCEQVTSLIQASPQACLSLAALSAAYVRQHGYALRHEAFECTCLEQLLGQIPHTVKVLPTQSGTLVTLVDHAMFRKIHPILMDVPDCKMEFQAFVNTFWHRYKQSISLDIIQNVRDVQVTEADGKVMIEFSPLMVFARNVHHLLLESNGRLPLALLEPSYLRRYGKPCQPAQFGFTSLGALLQAIPSTAFLRGRGSRRTVVLNQELNAAAASVTLQPSLAAEPETHKFNGCVQLSNDYLDIHSNNQTDNTSSVSGMDTDTSVSSDSKTQIYMENNVPVECSTNQIGLCIQHFEIVGPPKPDTPAKVRVSSFTSSGNGMWAPLWGEEHPFYYQTASYTPYLEPSINIPSWPQVSSTSPGHLLSPTSNLLPAYCGSKDSSPPFPFLPCVVPPEPSELPLPQLGMLTQNNTIVDTSLEEVSGASGSTAERESLSAYLTGESSHSTPSRSRRKRRLAAQFNTPIDLP